MRDGVADLNRTRECGGEQRGSREGAWKTSSFVGFGFSVVTVGMKRFSEE